MIAVFLFLQFVYVPSTFSFINRIFQTPKFKSSPEACFSLKIHTGKKHRQMKPQRLQKVQIWTFGNRLFIRDYYSETIFSKKNKVVTGKTPFFVIGQFCSHHFIFLNICFLYGSFVWKWCAFNLSATKNGYSSFIEKSFRFPENLFQS